MDEAVIPQMNPFDNGNPLDTNVGNDFNTPESAVKAQIVGAAIMATTVGVCVGAYYGVKKLWAGRRNKKVVEVVEVVEAKKDETTEAKPETEKE